MSSGSSQLFPINLKQLTDKERHNYVLNHFILNANSQGESRKHKRDIDVIRENHRFLWDEEDEAEDAGDQSWEKRLALRYYRKLFKEYCIADLSRYKENKIALRWRTEQEVVTGIGQFQCGSRHCGIREDLRTWEVNFKYIEQGAPQNALVKLRLCPDHTEQLNFHTKKREHKRQRRREKDEQKELKKKRRKIEQRSTDGDSDVEQKADSSEKIEELDETEEKAAEPTTNDVAVDEDVWRAQPDIGKEQPSREQEFERYLEDLLF